jgi:hypothetical protein
VKKYYIFLFLMIFGIPSALAEVTIQNDQPYIGDDGAYHIVGEIQNGLESPLNQVIVFVTLYDLLND